MKVKENLEKILPRIKTREFLENRGLGNELGFYIFDYPPEEELFVRDYIKYIFKQLSSQGSVSPVEIDLYKIMLDLLKDKKILDRYVGNLRDKMKKVLERDEVIKFI